MIQIVTAILFLVCVTPEPSHASYTPEVELARHLTSIAQLAHPSPLVEIPGGWFLMGTNRVDDDPYGFVQFDDTELPQRRVWIDHYAIDRDEVSIAEYHLSWPRTSATARRIAALDLAYYYRPFHARPGDCELAGAVCELVGSGRFLRHARETAADGGGIRKAARGTEGNLFPSGETPLPRRDWPCSANIMCTRFRSLPP